MPRTLRRSTFKGSKDSNSKGHSHSRKGKGKGKAKTIKTIKTIPELRRSFDYIDEFVRQRIGTQPLEKTIKETRREWLRVFSKTLPYDSAKEFVEHMAEHAPHSKGHRGGAQAGIYLAQGQPPTPAGNYPLASQQPQQSQPSAYGALTSYLSNGFWNPEIAAQQDPIKGQSTFPTPPAGMGSNVVKGGRRTRRRGGGLAGSLLTQAFTRPVPSSAPPSILQDAQTAWYGRSLPSPDQVQRPPLYTPIEPKPVNLRIDV